MTNTILLAVIALGLVLLAVGVLRQHQFRHFTGRQVTREQLARLRDQKRVAETMNALLTELDQFAQRVTDELEARLTRLQQTIADADARAARLEGLMAPQARTGLPEASIAKESIGQFVSDAPAESQNHVPRPPQRPVHTRTAVAGAPQRTTLTRNGASAARRTRPQPTTAAPVETLPPQRIAAARQRIYELADAGEAATDIAAQVGAPLGEIELLLGLRELNER